MYIHLVTAPLGLTDIGDVLRRVSTQRRFLLHFQRGALHGLRSRLIVRKVIQAQGRAARMLADEDQQVIDNILIVLRPQRVGRFAFPVFAAVGLRRAVGAFQKGRTACQQAQRCCGSDPAFHRLYASLPV